MPLTVLSIGYSLAPVGPNAVGGAEQILSALDYALVAAGHHSIVVAPEGSQVSGTLVPTAPVPAAITEAARASMHERQRRAIKEALTRWPIDLIHAHGLDFSDYLPLSGVPTLVTLHLPASFYPAGAVAAARPLTWFNCVSTAQQRSFPALPNMLEPIPNGVPVDRFAARHARRNFVMAMGRICPEKGFHLAIDAAETVRVPLLIAGQVYPYQAHQAYFAEQIRPRLGPGVRFFGGIDFKRKRRLLSAARCLLVPSLVAETSSLVAIEALACGTPVVAFPAGALADIVEPGVTGFLVNDAREMADAIHCTDALDRERCREVARRKYSLDRMVEAYFAAYRHLVQPARQAAQ
jgi:glycosyltransferase involved in cell wall biosynthesis